jgi:hypothetical protein
MAACMDSESGDLRKGGKYIVINGNWCKWTNLEIAIIARKFKKTFRLRVFTITNGNVESMYPEKKGQEEEWE